MSSTTSLPQPATPPPLDTLPHPLNVFLTARDRAEAVAALRRLHPDRPTALRIALHLAPKAEVRP